MSHIFDLSPSITTLLREYMLGPKGTELQSTIYAHLMFQRKGNKKINYSFLTLFTIILNEMQHRTDS